MVPFRQCVLYKGEAGKYKGRNAKQILKWETNNNNLLD